MAKENYNVKPEAKLEVNVNKLRKIAPHTFSTSLELTTRDVSSSEVENRV